VFESGRALERRSGAHHFDLFDGLRAIAVLAVLGTHVALATGVTGSLSDVARRLNIGVAIFFAISGFLLYRPLAARAARGAGVGAVGRYARRRVLRIVPAYWVALTLLAIWPGLVGVFSSDGPAYYGFVQIYGLGSPDGGIFPAWSLAIEMTFYAFLPLYAWLIARIAGGRVGWRLEAGGLVALTALAWVMRALLAHNGYHHPAFYLSLPGRFDWFVPGMALAVASVHLEGRASTPKLVGLIERQPLLPWAIAIAGFAALATFVPELPFTGPGGAVLETAMYAFVSFFLLLPAVFGEHAGGLPRRLLAVPVISWVGLISYGVYLYHYTLTYEFAKHFSRTGTLIASLLGSIAVAAASWYLIERPILRWDRGRRQGSAAPPGAAVTADPAAVSG
jgi:peptidoglycan/LPS O-acetylase OafA/YrhL